MKNVIILRGASGSGKSTVAELFQGPKISVAADDYFMIDGEYCFDVNKLGDAHADCQRRFEQALDSDDIKTVVVANTNTRPKEWKYYEDLAKAKGHRVFFIVVENRHGNDSVHSVPENVVDNQAERVRRSLKLI